MPCSGENYEEWKDLDTLEGIRNELSTHHFMSQYQQSPETPEGGMFKPKWFKTIDRHPPFRNGEFIVSIDSATSTEDTADYSAITLMYADSTGYYVLETERGRWDYEELLSKAQSYSYKYGDRVNFIVEAASNGRSLIYSLRKSGKKCTHYLPRTDKTTRASYIVPVVHQGHVYILKTEKNMVSYKTFTNEVCTFPYSHFDDQVDNFVVAVLYAENMFHLSRSDCLL